MRHFMREGGEDGFIGAAGEAVRVHRQFVHSRFLDAPGEALEGRNSLEPSRGVAASPAHGAGNRRTDH